MASTEQSSSTGPSTVVVMQRLHVMFGLFPEYSGVVGVDCSCGVHLWIIWGDVDISYCSVVFIHPVGMMLSGRLIGLLILNIPFMCAFKRFGFLMPFVCFTVIRCSSVSVVRVFSSSPHCMGC